MAVRFWFAVRIVCAAVAPFEGRTASPGAAGTGRAGRDHARPPSSGPISTPTRSLAADRNFGFEPGGSAWKLELVEGRGQHLDAVARRLRRPVTAVRDDSRIAEMLVQ